MSQGDRSVRGARAQPRAHPHLPPHAARAVERARRRPRRRAGRRHPARPTAGTPSRTPCSSTSRRRWRATAGSGSRSIRCTGWCWSPPTGPCSRRCCAPSASRGCSASGSTDGDTVVVHASERGNLKQALLKLGWPAEDFAGYVDGEAHPIELDHDGVVDAPLPARGGRVVLARRLRRRGAAVRRRQDPGRRGRDGRGQGDHADPRHQHRQRPAVEGRAAQADLPHGRGDRRVQRLGQGGPARHHRDVPGDDDQAEGRLLPPRAARRPRLGPHRLRRGAPAAGPDLPDDGQPPGPPPARPDRDARARGRPRGRRVLADRPQAVRRPVEGHRVAGLDRPGRLRRGPGHDEPVASGWRTRRPSPRSATASRPARRRRRGWPSSSWSCTGASRPW